MPENDLIPARVDDRPQPLAVVQNPMGILQLAVERGIDVASIKELSALAERWMDKDAERQFTEAYGEFKQRCPPIRKTKAVSQASDKGGKILYCFAPLEEIAAVVDPILIPLGFTYWWDSDTDDGKWMTATCFLRHKAGHLRTSKFRCPAGEGTSIMSGPQKAASAWSFARRQTFTAVLGITTVGDDRDGSDHDPNPSTITREQAATIEDLLSASGSDRSKFLEFWHVASVEELEARDFTRAVALLRTRMARKA